MDPTYGKPVTFYNNPPPKPSPTPAPAPLPQVSISPDPTSTVSTAASAFASTGSFYTQPLKKIDHNFSVQYSDVPSRTNPNLIVFASTFGGGDESRWPASNNEMSHLPHGQDKEDMWRKTAGEIIAKELKLSYARNNEAEDYKCWSLRELPRGYGLFEQVTQPRADAIAHGSNVRGVRLDRFIFGHSSRKIRSALSLGKHLSWLLQGGKEQCPCDGCKVVGAGAREGSAPPPAKRASPSIKPDENKGKEKEESSSTGTPPSGVRSIRGGARRRPRATVRGGRGRGRGRGGRGGVTWENASDEEISSIGSGSGEEDGESSEAAAPVPAPAADPAPQPQPEPTPPAKPINRRATPLLLPEPNPLPSDYPLPASSSRQNLDPDEAKAQEIVRRENIAYSQYMRVGELVWVRLPLSFGAASKTGLESFLTHWPALVSSRETRDGAPLDNWWQVTYKVNLVGMGPGESQKDREVVEEDVVPWLGYEMVSIGEVASVAETILSSLKAAKDWTLEDLGAASRLEIVAAFLKATQIARWFSMIQARSRPTLNAGPITVAHPQGAVFLSHPTIIFGPETLHIGDLVRLLPTSIPSLPAPLLANRSPLARLELPTTLMFLISNITRILFPVLGLRIEGRVFEMVELDNDEDEEYDLTSFAAHLPVAFPAHRWRSLHAKEADVISIRLEDIAGRYYAVHAELQDTLPRVNAIAEATKKFGVIGEYGTGALGLMLGGLSIGGKVPAVGKTIGIEGWRKEQMEVAEGQAMAQTLKFFSDAVKGKTVVIENGDTAMDEVVVSNVTGGDAMEVDHEIASESEL